MPLINRLRPLALALLLVFTAGVACKATVESEAKRWSSNVAAMKRYSSEYPNFKLAMDTHLVEVTKDYDAANTLSDEEAKAEAMQAANTRLTQIVGEFSRLERKISEINRLKRNRDLLSLPARQATPAIRHAEEVVREAEVRLREAKPQSPLEASALLKSVADRLDEASRELRRLRDRAKRERKKANSRSSSSSSSSKGKKTTKRTVSNLN